LEILTDKNYNKLFNSFEFTAEKHLAEGFFIKEKQIALKSLLAELFIIIVLSSIVFCIKISYLYYL
jgi:hypothetical protein